MRAKWSPMRAQWGPRGAEKEPKKRVGVPPKERPEDFAIFEIHKVVILTTVSNGMQGPEIHKVVFETPIEFCGFHETLNFLKSTPVSHGMLGFKTCLSKEREAR